MALVIDTLDLLHNELYDAFVIVASDSDYTPLAIRLHESGVYVMGVGEKTTPVAFRNACDEFVFLENLNKNTEVRGSAENEKITRRKNAGFRDCGGVSPGRRHKRDPQTSPDRLGQIPGERRICERKLRGPVYQAAKPDFDARTYGFSKLPDLVEAFPKKYSMKRYKGKGTVTIIAYKCI